MGLLRASTFLLVLACRGQAEERLEPPAPADAAPAVHVATPADAAPPPLEVRGLELLPEATRVFLAVDLPRFASSALVKDYVASTLARDPAAKHQLEKLVGCFATDLGKDVHGLILGMGADPASEVELVVEGRLDDKRVVPCISGLVAAGGGTVRPVAGFDRPVWAVGYARIGYDVLITFGADDTMIAATSEAWLRKAIDPREPKVAARPGMASLLARADRAAPLWGVGLVPESTAAKLVELAKGSVERPAVAVLVAARLDDGVTAELRLVMQAEGDARGLAEGLRREQALLAEAARAVGLEPVVQKMEIAPEGTDVVMSLALSREDFAALVAALAKR